ncbi:MAG: T9SS type A sorting domain-containing protein [Bacteroidota bacterium]
MKNALLLFFLLSTLSSFAQNDDWISFPLETGIWTNFTHQVGDGENSFPDVSYHYSILGDTIIEEKIYFKLIVNSDSVSWYNPRSPQVNVYVGAIRQEDRRVFFIPKNSIAVDTLYDFNIEVGDTTYRYAEEENNNCDPDLPSQYCSVSQLIRIDTLAWSDGTARRAYRFRIFADNWGNEEGEYSYSWIEGIGSTTGFFGEQDYMHNLHYATHSPHYWQELLCMEDRGELLYTGESYDGECNLILDILDATQTDLPIQINIFPNPTNNSIEIQLDNSALLKNLQYQWSDYTGKVLTDWRSVKQNNSRLDLAQLPNGLLFLTISDGQKQLTRKVVKMEN